MENIDANHKSPVQGSIFRAAEYVRMSTDHQQYSTHNQADKIREYAERRGIQIVRTYADEGKSGLNIEIISGKEEAEIIYSNHVEEHLDPIRAYLYIDVGGGSTELTLFDHGRLIASQSFDVGTIRWLQQQVPKERWEAMKNWARDQAAGRGPLTAIGSGGNINKIFKMVGRKDKPIPYERLRALYDELKVHTIEERMELWGLNADRADVIVPAARIYTGIMKAAQINEIIVPQIGLADGIVHRLHEERAVMKP
jgi:exopolyphosphatase/guanosine-5'-triphosphate,3'-diphosphate pyrophosphatase